MAVGISMASNGGISYDNVMDSNILEISAINEFVDKINAEIERKMKQ